MSDNTSKNIPLGTMFSPGFSYLQLSVYQGLFALNFVPWRWKDRNDIDRYCKDVHRSTTLDTEGATTLYRIAKSIIDGSGSDKPVKTVLPCKRDAELLFVYKVENNGQMAAYLAIKKDGENIGLLFPTNQDVVVGEDGKKALKVIQSGLGVFAKILDGYLTGLGADDKTNKLPVNFNPAQDYGKQVASAAAWNNPRL